MNRGRLYADLVGAIHESPVYVPRNKAVRTRRVF